MTGLATGHTRGLNVAPGYRSPGFDAHGTPAAGAWALVAAGTIAQAAASTITPAFGNPTTAGNTLFALVGGQQMGVTAIVTTCSDGTWAQVVQSIPNEASVSIWAKANCSASETAPTFSQSVGTSPMIAAQLLEFSGGPSTLGTDATSLDNNTYNPQSPSLTSSCTAADAHTGDLVIGMGFSAAADAAPSATMTGSAGAALTVTQYSVGSADGSTVVAWAVNDQSGTTADSATYTWPTNTYPTGAVASFEHR